MRQTMKLTAMTALLVLGLSTLSTAQGQQGQARKPERAYSLGNLYSLALEEAESIKRAREDVLIARKDKDGSRAVLMPRLTTFGSYSRSDYDYSWTDIDPPLIINSTPIHTAKFDPGTEALAWGVRLDQSFTLNGKELIALAISKQNIEKRELDLETAKETYLFQVAGAYFSVLRAYKGWEIAKASVERLEKHRDAVRTRLRLEDVTRTDMFRAESELSDARARLMEDQNRARYAKAVLRSLVNLPEDFTLMEPPAQSLEIPLPSLETLKIKGLSQRSEIKSARKSLVVSEKSILLAKGDYWPTLTIEGRYEGQEGSTSGTHDYDRDTTGYLLGAKLTFTLFDGGLRNAGVQQARARKRKARLALAEIRKQVALDIEDAYLAVMTQKSRLASLNDKLSFSRQNYIGVSKQFKYGLSNSVDMMDANTLLVAAERELAEAGFGYRLSLLRLKRSTGISLAENVEPSTD